MKAQMASIDDSDESLMALVQQGNHQAFSILVRRNTPRFFASAYHLSGNGTLAEDMVQEAFLKIWQKPTLWKNDRGAKFTTWFYRILVNMNIDRLRQSGRTTSDDVLEFVADKAPSPEGQTMMNEEQVALEQALASLPERQRTALNLCFYDGLGNAQAAEAMGVKLKALESLLMRAKAGLKDYYNNHGSNHLAKGERYGTR